MNVELLVVPNCPLADDTESLLATALRDVGLTDVTITTATITSELEAKRRGFTGSPTMLIDGLDPFAQAGQPPSLACRIYLNPNGLSGIPDLRQRRKALKQAAQRTLETTGSP